MNDHDYNFPEAVKLCGKPPYFVEPSGKCTKNAEENCKWFSMCDLPEKNPPKPPTKAREYRRSYRALNARIFGPGSQFFEKQDKIKK